MKGFVTPIRGGGTPCRIPLIAHPIQSAGDVDETVGKTLAWNEVDWSATRARHAHGTVALEVLLRGPVHVVAKEH